MPAKHLSTVLAAALALAPLCVTAADSSAMATAPGNIVAKAGTITLGDADVRALVADLPTSQRSAVTGNLNSLEQVVHADLVRRAVLAQAKASGFDRQPATLAQLDRVRDEALVRLWVASKAAVPAGYPSEAEIEAAYGANQQSLTTPTQYHLGQVFISAPDGGDPAKLATALHKAADIATKIASVDFSTLARQQSEDPASASRGGDLGYLSEEQLLPAVVAAVRTLKPGELVGPIKTAQGLSFIKLLDKKTGSVPTLAQVHDRLAAALRNRRATQLEQAYLSSYNATLGVTVNQIELAKLQSTLPR